jgi:signal transduction histidine kinase/CheY-like chemotaxis protein
MKLIRKKKNKSKTDRCTKQKTKLPAWKILIVDDDADIHAMTRLALDDFEFAGRKLQLFKAMSGIEAEEILATESKIAVALIDVVMETDDAGLRLVEFIRNQLKNSSIRLIIRTGQPGMAPEREVIERYDINDYKDKTELTEGKLYTTIRLALKSYRDMITLKTNQKALTKILEIAPELYHPQSITHFFNGVLLQVIGLCNLGENGLISTISDGIVVMANENKVMVQAGTGRFANPNKNPEVEKILKVCSGRILEADCQKLLPPDTVLIPLNVQNKTIGLIYLENAPSLNETNQKLIRIMVNQCTSALENLQLYLDLKKAHQKTSQMLNIAEQAREMANAANRAKTTFLAKMSHELRTPLNAIIGYSDLIQEDVVDIGCEDILPDLEKIQIAGKQLLTIITDILDISKIEANKLELHLSEFELSRLIEEVRITIQPILKGNQFNIESQGELGLIYADYNKLRQILLNLLSNATKFTDKGTITLTITRSKVSPESMAQNQFNQLPHTTECKTSDWLYFQVTDNGVGIPSEQLKIIFEPFIQADDSSTRKFGGTGLGLPISQHFCQAMGGNISVDSTVGEGSIFTVQLPAKVVL